MKKIFTALSPAAWNLLAALATVATLYQAWCLCLWQPATPPIRFALATTGFIAVGCWRKTNITRLPWLKLWRGIWWTVCRVVPGVFGLMLVAAFLVPLFLKNRPHGHPATPQSNLKQLALGVIQYAEDYDAGLPPRSAGARPYGALYPYLKNNQLWHNGSNGVFKLNADVLGHSLTDFAVADGARSPYVIAYAPSAEPSEGGTSTRLTAFTDARVQKISEPRFQALLRETQAQAAKPHAPKSPKP